MQTFAFGQGVMRFKPFLQGSPANDQSLLPGLYMDLGELKGVFIKGFCRGNGGWLSQTEAVPVLLFGPEGHTFSDPTRNPIVSVSANGHQ